MPEAKPKRLEVRLPPEVAEKLRWLAARQMRSMSSVACYAIDRMWQAEQAQAAKAAAAARVSLHGRWGPEEDSEWRSRPSATSRS